VSLGAGEVEQKQKRGIMKTITVTLFAAALGFAQNGGVVTTRPATINTGRPAPPKNQKPAQPTKPSPSKAAKTEPAQTIPAGAKLIEPNLYRFTDSNGKTWNYRQTPFGITKWEETPVATPVPQAKSEPVVITDQGGSYRFEKKTPFGAVTWTRKKTELTDDDKALLDHPDQPPSTASNAATSRVADKTKEDK
jgi:hypothetical protein